MKSNERFSAAWILSLCLVCVTGCASYPAMTKTGPLEYGPDYAVVNFIRPSILGSAIAFGIWDRARPVGVITPECCIQYKADPGEHVFLARSENWSAVKANLASGKTYTILVEPRLGFWKARVHLTVIKPGDKRLQEWMKGVTYLTIDPERRDAYNKRLDTAAERAAKKVDTGTIQPDGILSPEDGE